MPHLVLLGDSIFDNAAYVPGRQPVIEQVRSRLGAGWQASLLAVDGHVVADIERQLMRLPKDATHLAVSVGGNDALGYSGILREPATSVGQVLAEFVGIQADFREQYASMLGKVRAVGLPLVVCTIYDAIPGLEAEAVTALSIFNDVNIRAAAEAKVPVLDLRLVCNDTQDYSSLSPIEPSSAGGEKIARVLATIMATHDFGRRECVVFS